ncbi:UDP-N-acetylglucosamine 2-epimerase [Alphaproteobacteria bacterium]|nr:UDP-N-acetylglucosamine 2-epimerase [Alphaproteobacteria bacterium]
MKKICVVVASRANYGRIKYLMKAIQAHPKLELLLIVGASALLERYGNITDIIKNDGFEINRSIYYVVSGQNLVTQAKSTGLGIIELATCLQDLNPDAVVTVADRYETMATAIASTYMNIPLIHIQGGEVSGNIDDRVRHSITKLADVHFVATKKSADRVIKMGENIKYVFNYGCPSIDVLYYEQLLINNKIMKDELGAGIKVNWEKPYILMLQHPVTTSFGDGYGQVLETLNALKEMAEIQKVVIWPNIDAGSDDISKGIRHFRENNWKGLFYYHKNFSPEKYAKVLNNAVCCVGNSSSFIREAAYLGIPCVIVGDRQRGREHGINVKFSNYDATEILEKIKLQVDNGRYKKDNVFGDGNAGKKIAEKISNMTLVNLQK